MTNTRKRRKEGAEARVERLTWGLLVLIFAVVYLASEQTIDTLPNWIIPGACALVLLGSGIFQMLRRWRVSPITWIGGAVMLLLAVIAFYVAPQREFLLETLIVTIVVILFGTFVGET